jgi:hypothetical protein
MTTDELPFYFRSTVSRPRWKVRVDPTVIGQTGATSWVECRHDSWELGRWEPFHPTVEQEQRTRLNVRLPAAELATIERWADAHEKRTGVRLSPQKALVELLRRAKDAHGTQADKPDPVRPSIHADLKSGRISQVLAGSDLVLIVNESADRRDGDDRRQADALAGMNPEIVESVDRRKSPRRRSTKSDAPGV